jgi:hypothetical protein
MPMPRFTFPGIVHLLNRPTDSNTASGGGAVKEEIIDMDIEEK